MGTRAFDRVSKCERSFIQLTGTRNVWDGFPTNTWMQTYCWSFLRLCFLGSTAPDVTENTKKTNVFFLVQSFSPIIGFCSHLEYSWTQSPKTSHFNLFSSQDVATFIEKDCLRNGSSPNNQALPKFNFEISSISELSQMKLLRHFSHFRVSFVSFSGNV